MWTLPPVWETSPSDAIKALLLSINIIIEYVGENKRKPIFKELNFTSPGY